jgi:2-dehydro-3-deoxyphosphogluconate aldolase/(4S)-4-hydroxy-2-oxoglutarate aldolase
LLDSGLPIAEVAFRTEANGKASRQQGKLSELVLGAGTVLSFYQVQESLDAGAQFVVTSGFSPKVIHVILPNYEFQHLTVPKSV